MRGWEEHMDRALLVLSAMLLNVALAGPRRWYVALGLLRLYRMPAALIRDTERRLNREHRSFTERQMRGFVLVAATVLASLIAGWILGWLQLGFFELFILMLALPIRPTWDIASQIRKSLYAKDIAAARQALEGTVWRHHALLDEYGLARAGVEMLTVHFSEKIVAPTLFYILFGLPGLFVIKSVTLLNETLPQPVPGQGFSKATREAHFLLHYLTSRFASFIWLSASIFLPSVKLADAAKQMTEDVIRATPQRAALLAAASVLKLSLAGPTSVYMQEGWVGSGVARVTQADLKRALYLFALLHLFLFVFVGFFL